MSLVQIFQEIMAKASSKFGKHTGLGLFSDFEQRKDHLHQETRVDKQGHVSRRWVKNEKDRPKKKTRKPKAQAQQSGMPSLFDAPSSKKVRTTKPQQQASPLFDFNFAEEKPAAQPKPVTVEALNAAQRLPAADGSLSLSQDEYRAQQAGVLQVGSTKQENGKTYRLNKNHRWELVDQDTSNNAPRKITQAEYDANPDTSDVDFDHGHPTRLFNENGSTVSAPVEITDRSRPISVAQNGKHLSIKVIDGKMTVDGIKGSEIKQVDGQWQLHTPGGGVRGMTDDGHGHLSLIPKAQLSKPASLFDAPEQPQQEAKPEQSAPAPAAPIQRPDYDQPFTEMAASLPKFGFELLTKATPAKRKAANQEAIALSERLTAEGRAPSEEERVTLAAYTGDGGVTGDLNAHYTPTPLAGAMWRLLHRAGVTQGDVLEPSMGAGVFMETAPAGVTMHGVELSPVTQKVAKLLHQDAQISEPQPFERYNVQNPDKKFAGIISNPPYGSRGQVAGELDKPDILQAERYFIDTGLDKLEDGGIGVFLTNPGPFESEEGRKFRAQILARADVLGLYQLPQSTFDESGSGVPPVVCVLKKRKSDVGLTLARLVEKHGEQVLTDIGIEHPAFLEGTHHLQPRNMIGEFTGKTLFRGYKEIKGDLSPEALSKMTEADFRPTLDVTQEWIDHDLKEKYGEESINSARDYAASYRAPKEGDIKGDLIFHNHRWHRIADATPELSDALDLSKMLQRFAEVRNNGQTGDAEHMRQEVLGRVNDYLEKYGNPHDHASVKGAAKRNHSLANLLIGVSKDGTIAPHLTTPLKDEDDGSEQVDKNDLQSVAAFLHGKGRLTPEHVAKLWAGADGDPAKAKAALLQSDDIALTEDGRFLPASAYFHGHVHQRAASLDAAAENEKLLAHKLKYQQQAERFRSMMPRKSLEEIEVTPREKWIPPEVLEAYINEVVYPKGGYTVSVKDSVIYVNGLTKFDTDEVKRFKQYLNYALNPDAVRGQKDMSRSEIAAAKAANLESLRREVKQLEDSFGAWLSGSEHRDAVEDAYNKTFNSYLPEVFSNAPLETESDNWTGPKLHDFQRQDVRFMLQQGGGITALDVGLGKTHTGIALVNELQRTGKSKKPMVIVPRSLLPNWRQSFAKDHADATIVSRVDDETQTGKRVLVIGQSFVGMKKDPKTGEMKEVWKDDSGDVVAQKLVRAAQENWHSVLITRDWFHRIPMRPESWQEMVATDVQRQRNMELAESESEAYTGQGRKKNKGKTAREEQEEIADKLVAAARKLFKNQTNPLYWEDLGIDAVFQDEAHAAKNLHAAPRVMGDKSPKFMGAGGESKRAQDFNYKCRQVRAKNGGHGVYLLTATPTKNSPLEIFNMLSHCTDALAARGIGLTEDFVARYCKIEPCMVPQLDGTYTSVPAVVGFKNLGELRGLLGQYVFRRTKDSPDVKALPGWHVPERDDIEQTFEMDSDVRAQYDALAEAAKYASTQMGGFDESGRHVFSYLADMRKLTLDPQLMGTGGEVNPRFKKASEIAKRAADEGGKTVMFMDLGKQRGSDGDEDGEDSRTPDEIADAAAEYGIQGADKMTAAILKSAVIAHELLMQTNAYDRLVNHLVKEGIPRERIGVVTGDTAKSAQARLEFKEAFNRGDLDVVIGSTPVIGEGFSLQRGTTDMVHLDTPWDPGTYQQRLGRAQRQGNKVKTVRNHVLLADKSFDAVTYGTMLGKQGWMHHLWESSLDEADNAEASSNSLEEMAAMLDGDPTKFKEEAEKRKAQLAEQQEIAARKMVVDDVRKYSRQLNAVHANSRDYTKMEGEIKEAEAGLPHLPASQAQKVREGLERKRGQLAKLAARKDKIESQVRSFKKRLLANDRLTPEHRALLERDEPFLLDEQGGHYAKGTVFRDATGKMRRVAGIDSKGLRVGHLPLLPASESMSYQNALRVTPISEMVGTEHGQRTPEHVRDMFSEALKDGDLDALKRVHPDLATEHEGTLRAVLGQHSDYHTPNGGLWTVGPDGKAQYNHDAQPRYGSRRSVPEGHRLLLPTHHERELLIDALNGLPKDLKYRAYQDAPHTVETQYYPEHRHTLHTPEEFAKLGRHIIKAEQGSLVNLYLSLKGSQ